MTKLGTPIGAGPKGAIVVVGLARVGAPPEPNWRAAVGVPSRQRLVAAAGRARGLARAPSCEPPPLASPRSSLWVTPPRTSGWLPPPIVSPCFDGLAAFCSPPLVRFGAGVGVAASGDRGCRRRSWRSGRRRPVPRWCRSGLSQSGSAMSTRPSPSSSRPLAQAGAGRERDRRSSPLAGGRRAGGAFGDRVGAGHRGPCQRRGRQQGGEHDDRCDLGSHPSCASMPADPDTDSRPLPPRTPGERKVPVHPGRATTPAAPQQVLNQRLLSCLQMPDFQASRMSSLS